MLYRQGDVMIESIDEMPTNGIPAKTKNGRIILAEGEATGHHHSICADDVESAFINDETGAIFLRSCRQTELTHQEHGTITIPPGMYRITRQREYSPEQIRNVAD